MATKKVTKGTKISGSAWVVRTGTSACYGGPGETPFVVLEIDGKEWYWFTRDHDRHLFSLRPNTWVMVDCYGYDNGNLRRVALTYECRGELVTFGRKL